MKKVSVFIIVLVVLSMSTYAETSYNYLTKGWADTLYCAIGGDCNLKSLQVENLTVNNTIFLNTTFFNITGDINLTGTIYINGTDIDDIYVNEDGDIMSGALVVDSTLNVTGVSYFDGDLIPITSLTHDIGSGTNRWNDLYVTDISADSVDSTGNITTLEYFVGSGAYLTDLTVTGGNVTFINASPVMDENLTITNGVYSVTISGTTIYSDTLYAPLLQLGGLSTATGAYSVAIGLSANASSTDSIAIGSGAVSKGAAGIALGSISYAKYRAISLGYWNDASGDYSTALGSFTNALGESSTAIGSQTMASGDYSVYVGSSGWAEGDYSIGIGKSNNASGKYSFAFGNNVTVIGEHSFGFGQDGVSIDDNMFTLHNIDINMTGNVTANHFYGGFNWTVGDSWATFDGGEWLFNESKLSTIYYNATQAVAIYGNLWVNRSGENMTGDLQLGENRLLNVSFAEITNVTTYNLTVNEDFYLRGRWRVGTDWITQVSDLNISSVGGIWVNSSHTAEYVGNVQINKSLRVIGNDTIMGNVTIIGNQSWRLTDDIEMILFYNASEEAVVFGRRR